MQRKKWKDYRLKKKYFTPWFVMKADTFMKWAKGEKELKHYPEGMHVCANYLDETDAYMIDWFRKHL